MGEFLMMGHICTSGSEIPMDFDQIKVSASIYHAFLRFHKVLVALVSQPGRWGGEM
jgi:hypothetical protein